MAVVQSIGSTSGAGTTGTLIAPSGTLATDLVLVLISWQSNAATPVTLTPPTGVTALSGQQLSPAANMGAWAATVVGTGAGTAISFSASARWVAHELRISSAMEIDALTTGTVSALDTSGLSHVIPGQVATAPLFGSLTVNFWTSRISNSTGTTFSAFTTPSGYLGGTPQWTSSTTANNVGGHVAYATLAAAGVNTAQSSTATDTVAAQNYLLSAVYVVGSSIVQPAPNVRQAVNRAAVI